MIAIRCFDSFSEAEFLRDPVNALNLRSAHPDPFSTFEFLESFFGHDEYCPEGQGSCLWFLTAFEDNKLVGYIALKRTMQRIFGARTSRLGFLVDHDTDRPHLVADETLLTEVHAALYDYLLERKQEWTLLVWHQQDTSLLWPTASMHASHRVREWPSMENCTVRIRWLTLADYFGALGSKFRNNVARQMRHLLGAGNVEWLSSSNERALPMLFDLYRSIEPRSWKARANAHIGRSGERVAHVRSLFDARQPMRVSVQLLLLDGVPVAGLIVGVFMQGMYALHIVYDATLSRLSPGTAILLMGMRQAIEGHYAFFNLLSGFEYYKSRWLATTTVTRNVQIYRIGSLAHIHRILGDCRRRLFAAAVVPMRFNQARRDTRKAEAQEMEAPASLNPQLDEQERARIGVLIAESRKMGCEYLSTSQLAALMPFDTPLKVR